MTSRIQKMQQYLKVEIAQRQASVQKLEAEDRPDEAVFAKVQGNVFGIFSTVLETAAMVPGIDSEKGEEFFRTKLEQIPANWRQSLARATAHGDSKKAHMEQVKLEAVVKIKAVWEENQRG